MKGEFGEEVWMCHVCEQAPATVTCKADAAALCDACDADIHSANPLAHRHERVPIDHFFGARNAVSDELENLVILNSNLNPRILGAIDADPFLDFEFDFSIDKFKQEAVFNDDDSFRSCKVLELPETDNTVVPLTAKPMPSLSTSNISGNCFQINFGSYEISPVKFSTQSGSSSEAALVPEETTVSDASTQLSHLSVSGSAKTKQRCRMDREARVLRYREKRKNRKFQKTIRYASRKAYAETRPRIKGRFVRRTHVESAIQPVYAFDSPSFGVVPTF